MRAIITLNKILMVFTMIHPLSGQLNNIFSSRVSIAISHSVFFLALGNATNAFHLTFVSPHSTLIEFEFKEPEWLGM